MKIVVCVKQVIDSEAKIQIKDDQLSWGESPMVLNPFDEYAVEAALQLKERYGAEVIVLSIGGPEDTEGLRRAMAMGAESAILISDPAYEHNDQLATSSVIAKAIQKIGSVDVVLFGRQTLDHGSGLTSPQVARMLGIPFLGLAGKIEIDNDRVSIERILEESKLIVSSSIPAVISVVQSIGEPRYPSFMGIRKAAKADIPIWNNDAINGEVPQPKNIHLSYIEPTKKDGKCEMINGNSPIETAQLLVKRVLEAKVL